MSKKMAAFDDWVQKSSDPQIQNAIAAIRENYKDGGLTRAVSFVNADFSDEERTPSGHLYFHPNDAKVHTDSIDRGLFDVLVVTKIHDPNHELTDEHLRKRLNKLNAAIPRSAAQPPRLYNSVHDGSAWTASLGKDGHVGAFKMVSHDLNNIDYYIVAQACPDSVYRDFKKAASKAEMTFEDLASSSLFAFSKKLAKRNAQRLAYVAARALGASVSTIPDNNAFVSDKHIAKPLLALPTYVQFAATFEPVNLNGTPHIGHFAGIVPAKKVFDEHIVSAGPHNGLTIFNVRHKIKGQALPATTQKRETPIRKNVGKFVSDRKIPSKSTYGQVDDEFLRDMSMRGWKQEGVNNRKRLVPVVVKV